MLSNFFFCFLCLGNILVEGQTPIYADCQEALEKACDPVFDQYFIKVHGTDDGFVQLRCDQEDTGLPSQCPGGGWTPVLHIAGNTSNFEYESPYWTNRVTINEERGPNFEIFQTVVDVKLATYWSTPFNQICIKVYPGLASVVWYNGSSLESVIRDGQERVIINTNATTWDSLSPDFNITILGSANCSGVSGFNVGNENFMRARFGIVTAEGQTGCASKMHGIGMGLESADGKHLSGGVINDLLRVPATFSIYVRRSAMDEGGDGSDEGEVTPPPVTPPPVTPPPVEK